MREMLIEELNKFFDQNFSFSKIKIDVGRGTKNISIRFSGNGLETTVRLKDKPSWISATWELKFDSYDRVFELSTKEFITIVTTYLEFVQMGVYKPDMGPCLDLVSVTTSGKTEWHVIRRDMKYNGKFNIISHNVEIRQDSGKAPNLAYLIYIPLILAQLFPKFKCRYLFSLDGKTGRIGPYMWETRDYIDEDGCNYWFKIISPFPIAKKYIKDDLMIADIYYTRSGNFILNYKSTSKTRLCPGNKITTKSNKSIYYIDTAKDEYGKYLTIKRELATYPGLVIDSIPLIEYKDVIISRNTMDKGYFYIPFIK